MSDPAHQQDPTNEHPRRRRVVLIGSPNVGKSTLFNRLTGRFTKTSNFPGTTLSASSGALKGPTGAGGGDVEIVDLPGVYSLELDVMEARICREVTLGGGARAAGGEPGRGGRDDAGEADLICVVADASNLRRGLVLAGQAMNMGPPVVLVVNMIDSARRRGVLIDEAALSAAMGARAIVVSALTGEGVEGLRDLLPRGDHTSASAPADEESLLRWADEVYLRATTAPGTRPVVARIARHRDAVTDTIDRVVMHPVAGVLVFALVMGGLFWLIFSLATIPMDLIDSGFGGLTGRLSSNLPEGPLTSMVADGVVAGVGATVIFLPQICLLFFVITLLEDSGYLARASLAADRLLRPFGLTGHSFVPLLSSHACALPGIMAARGVPDPRARLATILVAPFTSCTARIPVYVLLVSLLFAGRPMVAALAMVGCYALGVTAAVLSSLLARRTFLKGQSRSMAMELPAYKWPSLGLAGKTTLHRGWYFLKNAGTNILAISVILWWLSAYPRTQSPEAIELARQASAVLADSAAQTPAQTPAERKADETRARELTEEANRMQKKHQASHSYIARIGDFVQPVFAPLGFDRQLTVGVMASFAAREVFASTMAIVTVGEDDWEGAMDKLAQAQRDDGRPIFTKAASWSLLVYYVLAMQCLPTLAVTARESGHAKWAWLQFAWMTAVAYAAAAVTFAIAS